MASLTASKRTTALVIAVVLAALATITLVSWSRGLEKKAFEGTETVSAYVAKDDIAANMKAEDAIAKGLIEKETLPRAAVADDAITTLQQIAGKVASVAILKGEQIVGRRWTEFAATSSILPIPPGRQAITVETDLPPGVGGFVRPGDRVSIIAKGEAECASRTTRCTVAGTGVRVEAGQKVTLAKFILQDVQVLAVDRKVLGRALSDTDQKESSSSSNDSVMLTLAVTASEAEKVAFGVLGGKLYFTLLNPTDNPVRTTGRGFHNLFS